MLHIPAIKQNGGIRLNYREIKIYISSSITDDRMGYIADCWIDFVVNDLGLEPNDAVIILP